VPTLVTDDGVSLVESGAILDWLDELVGPGRALIAASGPERRAALQVCALASGLADKAVSLVYEALIHARATPVWVDPLPRPDRRRARRAGGRPRQARAVVVRRAARQTPDIIVGCVLRFVGEAHPQVFDRVRWPALAAHAEACEGLPDFAAVVQPFHATPPRRAETGGARLSRDSWDAAIEPGRPA
jgi:glutathione S-transferase